MPDSDGSATMPRIEDLRFHPSHCTVKISSRIRNRSTQFDPACVAACRRLSCPRAGCAVPKLSYKSEKAVARAAKRARARDRDPHSPPQLPQSVTGAPLRADAVQEFLQFALASREKRQGETTSVRPG